MFAQVSWKAALGVVIRLGAGLDRLAEAVVGGVRLAAELVRRHRHPPGIVEGEAAVRSRFRIERGGVGCRHAGVFHEQIRRDHREALGIVERARDEPGRFLADASGFRTVANMGRAARRDCRRVQAVRQNAGGSERSGRHTQNRRDAQDLSHRAEGLTVLLRAIDLHSSHATVKAVEQRLGGATPEV